MCFFKRIIYCCSFIAFSYCSYSQDLDAGQFSGNFQFEARSYSKDSLIGAPDVAERMRSNGFMTLRYTLGKVEVGMRYENYLNPILGYDQRLQGQGIANKYFTYRDETIDVTAGNFYEQFGSGIIFRAYEEWALGFDNSMDGIRVKLRPTNGVEFTGLIGSQRFFWDQGPGLIRGGDLNLSINSVMPGLLPDDLQLELGGSAVSRYQKDEQTTYNLPENVMAYSTRMGLTGSNFSFNAEYAYKYNDPTIRNKFKFTPGQGFIINGSYFVEGLGISLDFHRLDNMDFRSNRDARSNELNLNFVPPLTKQHTYGLAAIFPFSTQPNGEAGMQAELTYQIPKNFLFFGEYGANLEMNYSVVRSIDTTWINKYTYDSPLFSIGDRTYFQDFNIELSAKINSSLKTVVKYLNITYDKDIMENEGAAEFGKVNSNVLIFDITYKFDDHNSLRTEIQHLWFSQDSAITTPDNVNGNWAQLLFEYTIAPSVFITLYDQYNYGNNDIDHQIHYINGNLAYSFGQTRIGLGYGRQRSGIICVGGVCRYVPAANGLNLTITSSF